MSEGGEGSRKIKVVDRRRFDESGELRPDRPKPDAAAAPDPKPGERPARAEPTPPATPESAAAGPRRPDAPRQPPGDPTGSRATSPLFLELVGALAQQAELLISGAEGLPAQPAEAQRVIEYLSMLESKTSGNLSSEESQVLGNVIFQLRTLYVQQTK